MRMLGRDGGGAARGRLVLRIRAAWRSAASGELAGFLTGWMYWYFWVIVVALEAVAGADADPFLVPASPRGCISLALLLVCSR